MENVRKDRNIKLVITERRRNYLLSKSNYHAANFFWKYASDRNEKTQTVKPFYLGLSISELSKIVCMSFGMIM